MRSLRKTRKTYDVFCEELLIRDKYNMKKSIESKGCKNIHHIESIHEGYRLEYDDETQQ